VYQFLVRRILESLLLLFGVLTLVFFLSRLLPGDATTAFLSPNIPPAIVEQLKDQFGLNRSLVEQYLHWVRSACAGNFGFSFTRNAAVAEVIGDVFPNTLLLGAAALLLEIAMGMVIAALFFLFEGRRVAAALSHAALVMYALPSFWVGMLLLLVFSYGLGALPSSHMYSSGSRDWFDVLRHLVLPAFTAAIPAAAGFARYLSGSIQSVLHQDYFLAAQSMGLSQRQLFRSYVLPNALSPMITLIGVEIGVLFGGVLVTEYLFSWPGIGRLTVSAIASRDYPLILGCTAVVGAMVIVGNVLADILNASLDPRIRLYEAGS
jgi:peptide/nickel transport system permease protein